MIKKVTGLLVLFLAGTTRLITLSVTLSPQQIIEDVRYFSCLKAAF